MNENTPHCERRESWEAYTPAESLCWSFGIKAERSFLCWNLARRLLHRPLKPLGCFCSESIKSLLDVWSWKKKCDLFSQTGYRAVFQTQPSSWVLRHYSSGMEANASDEKKSTLYYNQQKELKSQPNTGQFPTLQMSFIQVHLNEFGKIQFLQSSIVTTIFVAICLTSLYFGFFICKMELVIVLISLGCKA